LNPSKFIVLSSEFYCKDAARTLIGDSKELKYKNNCSMNERSKVGVAKVKDCFFLRDIPEYKKKVQQKII